MSTTSATDDMILVPRQFVQAVAALAVEDTGPGLMAEAEGLLDGAAVVDAQPFQARVKPWMDACFGPEISADKLERNDRFIEEALELCQASGYTAERAHALVDYTFNRPQGEINQEVGGVMVTLAAHCLAHGVDMHEAGEKELARVWTKVEQIRAKQAAKPRGSALPIPAPPSTPTAARERALERALKPFAEIGDTLEPDHAETWFDITRDHGLRGRNFHAASRALSPSPPPPIAEYTAPHGG